ncbi:2_t:CDS:2 [Acaulospora morrowiae]|uniref:2_t:CDS:1 n=1 Tax=Acaulospora morrowiae TaxID=94023 RepID=A0A9N8WS71_9GLOM|nr:2_t:CDS:2 [Acaulospora morrowiae]
MTYVNTDNMKTNEADNDIVKLISALNNLSITEPSIDSLTANEYIEIDNNLVNTELPTDNKLIEEILLTEEVLHLTQVDIEDSSEEEETSIFVKMQQNKPLVYGLNLTSKKSSAQPPKLKRASIFDEDDDQDSNRITDVRKNGSKSYMKVVNEQILSSSSISQSVQEQYKEALEEDPTAFAYDEVYDDMKSAERKRLEEIKGKDKGRIKKPKYVDSLLKAAEIRQRDYIRAQERKVQKEREAEGGEFEGMETFVTPAYKAQQEELRKAEEEERLREEKNAAGAKDMTSFYRKLLDQTSSSKTAAIEASRSKRSKSDTIEDDSTDQQPKTDKELADQARAAGKMVILNDDEQIVDKRQLLSAGLNVVKKKTSISRSSDNLSRNRSYNDSKRYDNKYNSKNSDEMRRRERQSRELENQILETQRKRMEEEKHKEQELLSKLERKNDDKAISDARARYLSRKKKD